MENQPANSSESLRRRKLSATEHRALRPQPELELEAQLTAALAKILDAPVPSNFTTRLLTALELEEKAVTRTSRWAWNWRLLWPRLAITVAFLFFVGISFQHYEMGARRNALAKVVARLAVAQPPSVEVLENLDAIQRMNQPVHADGELLAALQ